MTVTRTSITSTCPRWATGEKAGGRTCPSWTVQQQLIDLYFKAFSRTSLLMNFDEPPR